MAHLPNAYYFFLLTEEEKVPFMHNLKKYCNHTDYLGETNPSFAEFINHAFQWKNTEEGHEYWSAIYESEREKVFTYTDYLETFTKSFKEIDYKQKIEDLSKQFDVLQLKYDDLSKLFNNMLALNQ